MRTSKLTSPERVLPLWQDWQFVSRKGRTVLAKVGVGGGDEDPDGIKLRFGIRQEAIMHLALDCLSRKPRHSPFTDLVHQLGRFLSRGDCTPLAALGRSLGYGDGCTNLRVVSLTLFPERQGVPQYVLLRTVLATLDALANKRLLIVRKLHFHTHILHVRASFEMPLA